MERVSQLGALLHTQPFTLSVLASGHVPACSGRGTSLEIVRLLIRMAGIGVEEKGAGGSV